MLTKSSSLLQARHSAPVARHTSRYHEVILLEARPGYRPCHDQDSTYASRQKAAARPTQEIRSYDREGGDREGEAHKTQSREEGQEERAREAEERRRHESRCVNQSARISWCKGGQRV
jgi:hypothetical protein